MFKQILVVGMMLLSGVAYAQQRGSTQIEVTLDCYPIKTMVEAVKELRYDPVLTSVGNESKTLFYSVWAGPQGEMLFLGSNKTLTCIIAEGAELKSVLEGE